jgi:hypothetical protein
MAATKLLISVPAEPQELRNECNSRLTMIFAIASAKRQKPLPFELNNYQLNGKKATLVTAFCDSVEEGRRLRRSVTEWLDVPVCLDKGDDNQPVSEKL